VSACRFCGGTGHDPAEKCDKGKFCPGCCLKCGGTGERGIDRADR